MASVLDLGLLEYFTPVFVLLFIFSILYAIIDKTKVLGDNKFVNLSVSITLSLLFVITNDLMQLITIVTPWIVILLIAVMFIMIFFLFVGVKGEDIANQFQQRITVWIILLLLLGIFGYGLTQVYGEDVHTIYGDEAVEESEDLNQSIGKILFHPKVLSMMIILIIAAQAVRLIGQGVKP